MDLDYLDILIVRTSFPGPVFFMNVNKVIFKNNLFKQLKVHKS